VAEHVPIVAAHGEHAVLVDGDPQAAGRLAQGADVQMIAHFATLAAWFVRSRGMTANCGFVTSEPKRGV